MGVDLGDEPGKDPLVTGLLPHLVQQVGDTGVGQVRGVGHLAGEAHLEDRFESDPRGKHRCHFFAAQRSALVDTRVANERKEAESRGVALKAMLDPVRDVDWRTLLAMQGTADSSTLIASAFDQLAQGAEKIGQLNISPELLQALTRQGRE